MTKTQIRDLIKKAANRKKGIGAIPVGLKFTIAGVKMYVEAQFDIYNKIHINIIDSNSLKTVVKIDGITANKKRQVLQLLSYVKANTDQNYGENDFVYVSKGVTYWDGTRKVLQSKQLEKNVTDIINQLSEEVSDYNKSGGAVKKATAATKTKTATKKATAATKTKTATKKAKRKPTEDTGVLKYSKALGNGKYEYKYVKKRK